eukprot:13461799-Ditylum_brightwellii.AAC.1
MSGSRFLSVIKMTQASAYWRNFKLTCSSLAALFSQVVHSNIVNLSTIASSSSDLSDGCQVDLT